MFNIILPTFSHKSKNVAVVIFDINFVVLFSTLYFSTLFSHSLAYVSKILQIARTYNVTAVLLICLLYTND